jgi:serine/threonine protein kinase
MSATAPSAAAEAPPLGAGEPLAPGYTVLTHLHRGNDLDVYDVWSEERDCRCVAKLLRPDLPDAAGARRRLLAEGRLLQRLTHPHIVRAYATLLAPQPTVILETLPGATLGHLIDQRGRLPVSAVVYLGLHLCSAVGYLHRHRILHLDLKPSNIVADCGLAKVIDLSIARRPGCGHRGVGTRPYMSPEQARGDRSTEKADIWGIGAVLYESASGRRPFADEEAAAYPQLEGRAAPIRRFRRLPPALASAIDACLEPAPAQRPTVGALAAALRGLAGEAYLPAPSRGDG